MATLIASKQISGVVTASVINGEFLVSGSSILTGSMFVTGAISASEISASSFTGDGSNLSFGGTNILSGSSQITISQTNGYTAFSSSIAASISSSTLPSGLVSSSTQIDYDDISDKPAFIGGTNVTVTSGSGGITINSTGGGGGGGGSTDISYLNQYTSSTDTRLGIIESTTSSLDQRLDQIESNTGSYGSGQDISSLNTFTSSIQTEVDGLSSATSSYLTSSGSVSYDDITSKPSGLLSGSEQITALGFVSESGDNIPAGTISGSEQITSLGFISSSHTDITSLNSYTSSTDTKLSGIESFTSSIQTEVDGISATTSSYLTQLPSGLVSGSYSSSVDSRILTEKTRIDNILSGANADYDQFVEIVDLVNTTDTENDTAFANHYTSSRQRDLSLEQFSSSIQTEVNTLSAATSSYLTSSGSVDYSDLTSIPSGIVSGSSQITALGFVSSSDSTPAGTISGSAQITALGFVSSSGDSTPAGTISGSQQITDLGFISSSDSTTSLNTFTSSIQTEVDGLSAATSSYLTEVPAGTVSGSEQITDLGFISSSDSTTSLNSYTSSTDARLTNIESTTSSLDQRLDQIESNTGSYSSTTDITHLNSFTSSIDTTIKTKINVDGVVSGSLSSSIAFDGNRTVSNTDLPSGVYNNNFGTSGSIQDFISSVFFPNTAPTINSTQFTIAEFLTSGSTVGTLSATDAEGQSITFSTQSAYSDDKVKVSTAGVITLTETATSESFNTTISGSIHAHEVEVKATDTFNSSTDKTIHIIVTPNEAPKFREGSTGGNVITNVTASLNENSSNGTLVKRVFFTDAESDTITIDSSSISPADHFSITKYSTYVDITQNTGSLDYETYPTYTFSISASDEHYQAGQDNDAIVTLPISVSVSDNAHPTINNQTLSSISENSSNGATVGSISATDVDSDTITFSNFELHKLELDNSNVSSGSYGGTSQATDPHENPFQMTSAGLVTRKTGVLINSDLINEYQYRVIVKDNFNTASNEAIVTIPISDDTPASISTNGTFRIVESAVSGALIRTNANGFSGTQADLSSNQSGTFTNSSNPAIAVNSSNGNLSLAVDLSGSVTQSGDTIVSNITFTNTFGTTTVQSVTANVVTNSSPTISFTNHTANFETDLALDGVTMVSMSVSDTESDTPYSASLSGTGASSLNLVYSNSDSSSIGIHANGNLSAGTYTYNVKVTDSYGESTTYSDRTITVATSADYGRVFVYDVGFNNATYNTAVGIDSEDSSTPPVATPHSNIGFLDAIINDDRIGDSSFTYSYGGTQTATKLGEASGSNLHDVLRTMGSSGVMSRNSAKHFVILFPSGSDMTGIPLTTTDSYGGSTAHEYVLEVGTDGTTIDGSNTLEASEINQITLATSHVGYTKWFMVGATNQVASSTNFNLGLNPSSGSGGA